MAKNKPNFYDTFEFPDYEYREYPKQVNIPDASEKSGFKAFVVNNSKEEKELLAEGDFTATGEAEPEKDEKTLLTEEARALGIMISDKWGIARLRDAVASAKKVSE